MSGALKIGFVGVGNMGQCAHLRNYVTLPDCEVTAIAELREDLRRKVAARYGVARTYATAAEMLANERLDGIVASQQFAAHGRLIPALLKARVPLFIEKPLARSVEAGERIVEAVRASRTWVMVGYHKRSDPAVMWAKTEIDRLKTSGEIGRLRYVRILMPAGDWISGGFFDLLKSGEKVPPLDLDQPAAGMDSGTVRQYESFVNYYIHQVNLARYLLGEPYEVTYADPSGVLLVGVSRSGVACAIEMSPYATTRDWQESALVAFEHGYVQIRLPAPLVLNRPGDVEVFRDPPGQNAVPQSFIPQLPAVHAMRQQAINFLKAIRGEIEPPCGAAEALEDLVLARRYISLLKAAQASRSDDRRG